MIRLNVGDTLVFTRSLDPSEPAKHDPKKQLISPARIGVTLPEFFDCVRPANLSRSTTAKSAASSALSTPDKVTVEITRARPSGEKLGAEKGINVPES